MEPHSGAGNEGYQLFPTAGPERPRPSEYQKIINISHALIACATIDTKLLPQLIDHISVRPFASHLLAALGRRDEAASLVQQTHISRANSHRIAASIHKVRSYQLLEDREKAQAAVEELLDYPNTREHSAVLAFAREMAPAYPEVVDRLRENLPPGSADRGVLAAKLGNIAEAEDILNYIMSSDYSRNETTEMEKFHEVNTGEDPRTFKAIPSKNLASFFAKAAVEICTDRDVRLYMKPTHFHLNTVEDKGAGKEFMGNVQAYIIEVEGKKALMLRGFNPTHDSIKSLSVAGFSEAIIQIGKKFVEENTVLKNGEEGLTGGLYLSDPLGAWHALSNSDPIQNYLIAQYIKPSQERNLATELPIAFTEGYQRTINKVYLVSP